MIKNWKLFLESSDDDDDSELYKNAEELKVSLKKVFANLFLAEFLFRIAGSKEHLEKSAELICNTLIAAFADAIDRRQDSDEGFKKLMIESFSKSIEDSKSAMINESFDKGLNMIVDNFIRTVIDYRKSMESEGEEWKQEKEIDYSNLTKSELDNLINQALDDRDFSRVKFLSQYLKESVDYNPEEQLKSICSEIAEILVRFIYDNIKLIK